jgi:hypothetical protein
MPDEREAARLNDYDRTVATVHQLTEVRFKLAAFLPALTGGAVALLASSELGPLTKASLALGGLIFSLGIVLYDLRNSQIYNAAIGRARPLKWFSASTCARTTRIPACSVLELTPSGVSKKRGSTASCACQFSTAPV